MTDSSQAKSSSGIINKSVDVILRMISQNITAPLVGFLCIKIPVLAESTWYEITVFVLAAVGTTINDLSRYSVWDNIKNLILWMRRGFKTVKSATDEPI